MITKIDNDEMTNEFEESSTQINATERVMKLLFIVLSVLLIIMSVLGVYSVLRYDSASSNILEITESFDYEETDDWYVFANDLTSKSASAGVVLLQKNKVDEKAYFYLANTLQKKGYNVFIPKNFLKQPAFSINIIDKMQKRYNNIDNWVIGCHGNSCGTFERYSTQLTNKITGLFYLGALPKEKTIKSNVPICVIYGVNDSVINKSVLTDDNILYHSDNVEVYIIEGGNHTNFGYYKLDRNDTEASITAKEQQDIVARRLQQFITKIK